MEGCRVNYYFTGALIILLCSLAFCVTPAYPNTTQNNTSGSNTSITGGYTSSATNTYQSGSSNNTTTTNNSTSNMRSAPPTASAPSVTNAGSDVCLAGASAGVQTFGIGVSGGKSFRDKNCERIKLSRELNSLGMKVAAVAILCQDERVFFAMEQAGNKMHRHLSNGAVKTSYDNKYKAAQKRAQAAPTAIYASQTPYRL